jgi:hypothetical protein
VGRQYPVSVPRDPYWCFFTNLLLRAAIDTTSYALAAGYAVTCFHCSTFSVLSCLLGLAFGSSIGVATRVAG